MIIAYNKLCCRGEYEANSDHENDCEEGLFMVMPALATLSHTTHSYYNDDLDEGDYIDLNKNNETNGTLANPHSPSHRKAAASVCGSSATGSKRRSLPSGLMFNGATAPNALTVSLQCLLHQKSVFCFLFSVVYFQLS